MRSPIFFACLLAAGSSASAASGDERWGREFHAPDFGTINTLAFTTNGDLICGGSFASIANVPGTANLARWDGTNWMSIGGGLSSATVFAVLPVGNDIYVGGAFTTVQGQNITNLARWNGSTWSAIGGGVTGGSVRALAWHDGALYVGGLFTNAGGNFANYIAAWNGSTWNTLAGGMQTINPSSSKVPVIALYSFGGSLWAGGNFFSVGGVNANNVARWNGSMWESIGTGADNGTDGPVGSFAGTTNGTLYIGGTFVHAGTSTVNNVTAWNGTTWAALDGGVTDLFTESVSGLLVSGPDLFVTGNFDHAGTNLIIGLARWNGSSWSPVSYPGRHPMSRIVGHGSRVVAAGRLQSMMVQPGRNGLIQFKEDKWSIIGGSIAGQFASPSVPTVAALNGKVQVSGYFAVADGSGVRSMVAEWDGKGWTDLGNGLFVGQVDTDHYVHDFINRNGLIHAAGRFLAGANGVMILSNNIWIDIGAPLDNVGLALAEYRSELFAGHGSGISRWTGSGWTNVGVGLNGTVYDLLVLGDSLYAGGSFIHSGGMPVNNIARWDGTNWSALGMGVDAPVYTLAKWQDELYAGGLFAQTGQGIALCVAKWHNATWGPLGAGFMGGSGLPYVSRLSVLPDGRIFAGGNFTLSGSTPINYVAWWNGTNWNPLGSGVNAAVSSIAADGNNLYLTGAFTTAGGFSSLRFARWRLPQDLHLEISRLVNAPDVSIGIRGELGDRFVLEGSPDLAVWADLSTNDLTVNRIFLPASTSGLSNQFFRARRVQ